MTRLEARLRTAAMTLPYPPTPDIAARVRRHIGRDVAGTSKGRLGRESPIKLAERRRWAMAVLFAALAIAALLAVPQVRAGLLEVIQIGVIRIWLASPTPVETAAPTTPPLPGSPAPVLNLPTRTPTPTLLTSVLDLGGETTLAAARKQANFTIVLPAYPPDLGEPDRVFVQDMDGPLVVLVWVDPDHPDKPVLSVHQFGPGTFAGKGAPAAITSTRVDGNQAVWTEGPYLLRLRNGQQELARLISGHVLIWEEGGMTYRVETDLPLEEAVRLAESLR